MEVNWSQIRDEAVQHLQALVRIDTSNPPGNELAAAEYLAGVLAREGLSPWVLKSSSTRGSIITRLRGSGEQPALMMMAHLDVVPADPQEWTHPPFCGDLIDGFVWGRGTVDCKGLVVANLMVALLCQRLGVPLKGDLTYMAHADEESVDFGYGLSWLIREHRELLDAPFALYEGAGDELAIAGKRVQTAATAEKGWCTVEVITRGQGGHSSVPHLDNPLFHMAPLLLRLQTIKMPVHTTQTVAQFAQALGELFAHEDHTSDLFRQLADPTTAEAAVLQLPIEESQRVWLDALLRNTATPTMIQGSNSRWALPSEARLTLNGRVLPGQSAQDFDAELRAILGAEAEYYMEGFQEGVECQIDSPVFRSIQRVMARKTPDVPVIPVLMTGGTERNLLKKIGMQVYSFWPRRMEPGVPSVMQMAHGVDERISVDNLLHATQCLFEIVCDLNGINH
jgi:acetylornithine deacetylase/succinyl-diaminopimelate desuccinylase-like protein